MGIKCSKKSSNESPPALRINSNLKYTAQLNSYEAQCRLDPGLESFDAILQQRTSRVINSLAVGVEVHSMSFDSLKEVTDCLLEMNQEVVKVILECKKDIWKNQELFDLAEEYFENSLQTLDFCAALEKCLKRTRDGQVIIDVALQRFEEERGSGIDGENYLMTLEELRNFKQAGDPFTEEFFILFQSVYKQQVLMMQKLKCRTKNMDKKVKYVKSWRRVSNVIFVAAFASVLIFSVVAAAIAAPPVVTALAGALAVPIGSVGKWINVLWTKYEKEVRGQKEIVSSMQGGTYVAIKDLDNIRVLLNKLEMEIESLLETADFALRENDAVKLVIDEIKRKIVVFMETIELLTENVDKCSREVRRARTVIMQRIIKHPSS